MAIASTSSQQRVQVVPTTPTPIPSTSSIQAVRLAIPSTSSASMSQAVQLTSSTTKTSKGCRFECLPTEERERSAAKLTNKCKICDARTSYYCSPRCFLEPAGSGQESRTFYCLNGNGNRNCFYESHAEEQPTNQIPIYGASGRCAKCLKGFTRFYCNQCDKRYCVLNRKGCFYSPDHLDECNDLDE